MDQQPTQPMGPFDGSQHHQQPLEQAQRSRKLKVAGTVAAVGMIGVLTAGGVAWAGGALGGQPNAQTNAYNAALTGPETPSATPKAPKERGPGDRGFRGRFGLGMGGALHGEFVVKQSDGSGYQTIATQTGEVTAVSETAVTLKSEDGYARTYTVTADTLVNSTRDGIDSVKKNDKVHVLATVSGDKATAVQLGDVTTRQSAREKWPFGKHR